MAKKPKLAKDNYLVTLAREVSNVAQFVTFSPCGNKIVAKVCKRAIWIRPTGKPLQFDVGIDGEVVSTVTTPKKAASLVSVNLISTLFEHLQDAVAEDMVTAGRLYAIARRNDALRGDSAESQKALKRLDRVIWGDLDTMLDNMMKLVQDKS